MLERFLDKYVTQKRPSLRVLSLETSKSERLASLSVDGNADVPSEHEKQVLFATPTPMVTVSQVSQYREASTSRFTDRVRRIANLGSTLRCLDCSLDQEFWITGLKKLSMRMFLSLWLITLKIAWPYLSIRGISKYTYKSSR